MKNQNSETTSVIKHFIQTIQKYQIDKAPFNHDLVDIQNTRPYTYRKQIK